MNTNTNTRRVLPSSSAEPVDLHAYRYRIVRDDAYGYALVRLYNGPHGAETFTPRTLEALRDRVAELRDVGAIPAARATWRNALAARVLDLHSATLVRVWPEDVDGPLPTSGYSLREWGLPVTLENLQDPTVRALSVPFSSPDPTGHDILGRVNADALLALEAEDEASEGLGWIGGTLVLDLDEEAGPDVLDALLGLETYPVVDEEALSEAEHEEDVEAWEAWGRREALEALASALDLDEGRGWTVDAEDGDALDAALLEAAHEQGRPSEESGEAVAERFIRSLSPLAFWPEDKGTPWADHVAARDRTGRPRALAFLVRVGALRLYFTTPEEPVRDRVPPSLDVDANARALADVLGEDATPEDEDVRRVAEALHALALEADRTGALPFPEEDVRP